MSLSFPTGQTQTFTPKVGYPRHPEPRHMCHCGTQAILDEYQSCVRCGRYPQRVIAESWEARKREVAMRGRKRAKAAA